MLFGMQKKHPGEWGNTLQSDSHKPNGICGQWE